jgi:hypothetical protein
VPQLVRVAHDVQRTERAAREVICAQDPYRDGTTYIVLQPPDLMARLAALIPPPIGLGWWFEIPIRLPTMSLTVSRSSWVRSLALSVICRLGTAHAITNARDTLDRTRGLDLDLWSVLDSVVAGCDNGDSVPA